MSPSLQQPCGCQHYQAAVPCPAEQGVRRPGPVLTQAGGRIPRRGVPCLGLALPFVFVSFIGTCDVGTMFEELYLCVHRGISTPLF